MRGVGTFCLPTISKGAKEIVSTTCPTERKEHKAVMEEEGAIVESFQKLAITVGEVRRCTSMGTGSDILQYVRYCAVQRQMVMVRHPGMM